MNRERRKNTALGKKRQEKKNQRKPWQRRNNLEASNNTLKDTKGDAPSKDDRTKFIHFQTTGISSSEFLSRVDR